MARLARKELADLRAMEEEDARMELHGKLHGGARPFYGAGATPSMGLSQFRGGAKKGKKCVSYDEDEMEGAGRFQFRIPGLSSLGRLGRTRAPVAPRGPAPGYGPGAIVPRPSGGPIVPAGTRPGVLPARPSMPQSYYQNLLRQGARAPAASAVGRSGLLSRLRGSLTASNLARAAALGVPLSMLGAYLADQGAANDGGYYDDYAGTEMMPGPGADDDGPIIDPGLPGGPDVGPGAGPIIDENGDGIPDDMAPGGMTAAEYNYLLSGAIEKKRRQGRRVGRGKLEITHGGAKKQSGARSARAAIVKKVMAERGVSLPQASRIVKEEGLY